ncbi:hypothetical protein [Nocardioides humi]|uniref:Uncharacterized protein n=1 Tax=Nocardioides humi TaxID=449461 RepID=A0ABN2BMU5_9ACTN|nr:hypothetical protein [Nocardioides humi]
MGRFGFSFVGAAFLAALFLPNLWWAWRARPAGYDATGEPRALVILERGGQVLTTAAALLFADTNLRAWSAWSWWLVAATAALGAYLACWIRYGRSDRTEADFYRPLGPVPVPLATLPVAAFVLLGVYGRLLPLVAATLLLGVGHIGIHLHHVRDLDTAPDGERASPRRGDRTGPAGRCLIAATVSSGTSLPRVVPVESDDRSVGIACRSACQQVR